MEEINMSETIPEKNKALVLEAFDTLFNKRDYAAAENFWSPNYIQHSAHIEAGRDGVVQFGPERTEYAALPASAHRCRARLCHCPRAFLRAQPARGLDRRGHRQDRERPPRRTLGCSAG